MYLLEGTWGRRPAGSWALERFLGSKAEKATWRVVAMGVKGRRDGHLGKVWGRVEVNRFLSEQLLHCQVKPSKRLSAD